MEGFYSKAQAGNILGVSVRQVDNYINEGKLRRIKESRRVWIPKKDVEKFYRDKSLLTVPTMKQITDLEEKVAHLERQIRILQRGLGFGGSGTSRDSVELKLLYQQVLDDLGEEGWSVQRVMEFTEDLRAFREDEMEVLLKERGPNAMMVFFDLARRMINHMESHPQYPSLGTQAVRDRLIQSRKVLLALLEVSMKIETSPFTDSARELYRRLGERPDFISDFVGAGIAESVGG